MKKKTRDNELWVVMIYCLISGITSYVHLISVAYQTNALSL